MKLLRYTYTALFLLATMNFFTSCDKDETKLSEAVLASANSLNFEGSGTSEQLITVYADAEWVTEVPDWITVSPSSGSGVMDVTISVSDNMREGAMDNPRKAVVVFKGRTLASRAEVLVLQAGDKFRDVKEYKISELIALSNETVVSVPNITVAAVTATGFVATDAQNANNVFVLSGSIANIGDKVTVMGTKSTNTQSLTLIEPDKIEIVSTGGSVTYPVSTDITDKIDTYNSSSRDYIEVSGILNGNKISVEGANYAVSITDAPTSLNLAGLNGHRVTVKGYFDGVAAPVVKIMASEIEDKGVIKVIYFSENFEWLQPWAEASGAGKTVETDNLSATSPQLPSAVSDGVSSLDALLSKGYEFLRVTTKTEGECIYLQNNYLKFGKTSYQAGIILPKLENVPSNVTTVLSFDWCPMRQGSGTIDPVNLIVIVKNGESEITFDVPESGFSSGQKLEWIRAEVVLTGITITENTKITIRQTQWPAATANRWFLDNIEIAKAN